MVFFLVEDTLFKVHSFFFERDSEYFRTMFRLHGSSSESRPIVLDVSISSFESFLGVLYPVHFAQHVATTANEWIAILALATEWSFATIRTLAIRELFPFASPIDKIVVGIRYDINEWLNDAYVAICERPEAVTKLEGERLGLDEVIKISKMRQDARIGYKLLARCDLVAMVRQSCCCEVGDGRDIPDVVDGGTNVSPPEVRVPEGSAIRGSSLATAEPSNAVPVDSNSLVTLNTALDANPPTPADSPPQLSSDVDPIPAPSQTLESFQRFCADCSRFSAEKPPLKNNSAKRNRQFAATMLLEWERLRVNAEVFDPHQTLQVEFTSIKDMLDILKQKMAKSSKAKPDDLDLPYARLLLLGHKIIRVHREHSGWTETNV
ncbi:hypothetical protein JAAARDRAFT_33729 [Jaapia argillacea MUCL 33604]|uniref:BTB domain-containing protein n=1 Tax=Jaapia argillacea MUCL 33604 TaxID=933084 RepID=A0A067Q8T5_9AGAM|nr:hypothetical protein JAAARDRAFT_33729 [Jaapia argillacea MUCL 33604]